MMLRFPLASLPAGRNGLSAGLNLYYNSKLYGFTYEVHAYEHIPTGKVVEFKTKIQ